MTTSGLLLTHPLLPTTLRVSGHVYDVDTGLVRTVVPISTRLSGQPANQPTRQETEAGWANPDAADALGS